MFHVSIVAATKGKFQVDNLKGNHVAKRPIPERLLGPLAGSKQPQNMYSGKPQPLGCAGAIALGPIFLYLNSLTQVI